LLLRCFTPCPYPEWPQTKKEFYASLCGLPELTTIYIQWFDFPVQLLGRSHPLKTLGFNGCVSDDDSQFVGLLNNTTKVELRDLKLDPDFRHLVPFLTWLCNPATSFIDICSLQSLIIGCRVGSKNGEAVRALINQSKGLRSISFVNSPVSCESL
jgi:hypothetical protein